MIRNLDRPGQWALQDRLTADRETAIRMHREIMASEIELVVPSELVLVVMITLSLPAAREGMSAELRDWIAWHVNTWPGLDPIERDRLRKWCSVPQPSPTNHSNATA